jgi:hypothetical protein
MAQRNCVKLAFTSTSPVTTSTPRPASGNLLHVEDAVLLGAHFEGSHNNDDFTGFGHLSKAVVAPEDQ